MAKLIIRCLFEENGCKEILENHEKSCSFDIKICEKYCIKSLLESKEKLDKRILELEDEFTSAKDEINSLKSALERTSSNRMALPTIPNWAPNSNRPNWSTRHPRPTWHHGSSRGTRPNFPNITPRLTSSKATHRPNSHTLSNTYTIPPRPDMESNPNAP